MTRSRLRVAVFASGGGSNFQSILDAVDSGDLEIDVVCCVSDRSDAGALDRAASRDIPAIVLRPGDFDREARYPEALLRALDEHHVTFIVLAGYLKRIPLVVVERYRNRILNVHPALLPAFGGAGMYGRKVHDAVIEYGVHWTGATVHIVEEAYDTGPIVLQEPVPVFPDDTPADVAARVLEIEHRLYPEALRLFAQDRIHIEGRRVRIREPKAS
jgi:phosphoribosylglycinamide formyltransferase-1